MPHGPGEEFHKASDKGPGCSYLRRDAVDGVAQVCGAFSSGISSTLLAMDV